MNVVTPIEKPNIRCSGTQVRRNTRIFQGLKKNSCLGTSLLLVILLDLGVRVFPKIFFIPADY